MYVYFAYFVHIYTFVHTLYCAFYLQLGAIRHHCLYPRCCCNIHTWIKEIKQINVILLIYCSLLNPSVFSRGSSRCQGSLADAGSSRTREEDAVRREENQRREEMVTKNGYQKEGEKAVTTFGVKYGLWHMETLGLPHVADTLGVNVNVIAEGFNRLLVSECRTHRKAQWSLWSG